MRQRLAAFGAGLLFALGLAIGGMTDPLKVISFLDVSGHWDPSLAFVMGGAIIVYASFFGLTRRWEAPLLDDVFHLPTRRDIDARLVVGAALFGAGWGLGGFCPGPALVSLLSLGTTALVFVASMLGGMGAYAAWQRTQSRAKAG